LSGLMGLEDGNWMEFLVYWLEAVRILHLNIGGLKDDGDGMAWDDVGNTVWNGVRHGMVMRE